MPYLDPSMRWGKTVFQHNHFFFRNKEKEYLAVRLIMFFNATSY